jgi:dynein heavy chain 1
MDFPMASEQIEKYVSKCLVQSLLWSFTGDSKIKFRQEMGKFIHSISTIPLPDASQDILDFEVTIEGNWMPWTTKVPAMEVETHKVGHPDIVVPTIDTVRHETLLYTWLADHKPMGTFSVSSFHSDFS